MTTPADIVNRAVQFVGGYDNQEPVTGTPPLFDSSVVGLAAGQLYDACVATVARQFGWDFARAVGDLVLTINTAPLGFEFEYAYPSNGIQVRQLVPPEIEDPNDPRPVRWVVGNNTIGLTSAAGYIDFAANPLPGATVTMNGIVYTFVASGAGTYEVNIGGSTAFTVASLRIKLNASVDPAITVATYGNETAGANQRLTVVYDALGSGGNAYTLAASLAVPSAATLTGGTSGQRRVIWTNLEDAVAVFTNAPSEDTWDALFTETVVRTLGSELALATAGKGDRSKNVLEQALGFEKMGEQRTDA